MTTLLMLENLQQTNWKKIGLLVIILLLLVLVLINLVILSVLLNTAISEAVSLINGLKNDGATGVMSRNDLMNDSRPSLPEFYEPISCL